MMSSKIDATTPTLDEAALPEFNGATLFLADGSKVLNIKTVPNNDGSYANSNKLSSKDSFSNEKPLVPGSVITQGFFSSRDAILQRAVTESEHVLIPEEHGTVLGYWLLTLVDHWDNEKERLIILCSQTIFIVKYDFIALVLEGFQSLPFKKIIRLTVGRLEYPAHSITPKFQSLAGRFSNILRGCYNQPKELLNWRSSLGAEGSEEAGDSFKRVDREGIRISWETKEEPKLTQTWNPWSKDIPWLTFLSHPLFSVERDPKYDVNDFVATLHRTLQNEWQGITEYKPIIMDTYIGIPALIYNYSQFGFYRVRGKVSF